MLSIIRTGPAGGAMATLYQSVRASPTAMATSAIKMMAQMVMGVRLLALATRLSDALLFLRLVLIAYNPAATAQHGPALTV